MFFCLIGSSVRGQDPPTQTPRAEEEQLSPLALKQKMVRDRFQRFEDRVFRLREQLAEVEPENAARLARALQRAGELGLADQLDEVVRLLNNASALNQALDAQGQWVEHAERLLGILLERDGENDERKDEIERLEQYKQEVERILKEERSLRSDTSQAARSAQMLEQLRQAIGRIGDLQSRQSGMSKQTDGAAKQSDGQGAKGLAPKQDQLSKDTQQLAEDLKRLGELQQEQGDEAGPLNEAKQAAQKASQSLQSGSGAMSQAGQQLAQGAAGGAQPSQEQAEKELKDAREALEAAAKKLEGQKSAQASAEKQQSLSDQTGGLSEKMKKEAAEGGQGSPGGQQGQQGQSGGKGGKPTPGMQNLDQAQKNMQGAAGSLKKENEEEAVPQQDKAIAELEQAQKELEKALSQLRKEERAETLRDLEHRFREMLARQRAINDDTLGLDQIGMDKFSRVERLKVAELVTSERDLSKQAATCLHILEEDATTIVFPKVLDQLSQDMSTVADRLAEEQVGAVTQNIEREIIETLEQLLEAVQRMQQENEQQGQPGRPGQKEDDSLLPNSAELKLLRASQVRINTRTDVITDAMEKGAETPDRAAGGLKALAVRQKETALVAEEMRDRQTMP